MIRLVSVILATAVLSSPAGADVLDEAPAMDGDPRCLQRKAAREAYLKSIFDAPVAKGEPCPPDPEEIRQRELACRAGSDNARTWKLISDGLRADSSMLSKGIPYVVEVLGYPNRVEADDGFWDIDVYEIPRTLFFSGITVETRDYVSDAVNFDLSTGTVRPTDQIYGMLLESADHELAFGLSLDSSREDVEAALGLPCASVARVGRNAVRRQTKYIYYDWSDEDRARYSITFNFHGATRIESIRWHYDSVWH